MYNCKKRCGYCCTLRVKLSWLDILRIMLAKERGFAVKGTDGKRYIKMIGSKCYFLTKKNGKPFCRIYNYRPRACRIYPYFNRDVKNCDELKKTFK